MHMSMKFANISSTKLHFINLNDRAEICSFSLLSLRPANSLNSLQRKRAKRKMPAKCENIHRLSSSFDTHLEQSPLHTGQNTLFIRSMTGNVLKPLVSIIG